MTSASDKKERPFTHEVVLRVRSNGADPECTFSVEWIPDLSGADYKELGYQPLSHVFAENWILPMLEAAYMHNVHPDLLEPPTGKAN